VARVAAASPPSASSTTALFPVANEHRANKKKELRRRSVVIMTIDCSNNKRTVPFAAVQRQIQAGKLRQSHRGQRHSGYWPKTDETK
jgi:hypothetical protein